MRKEEKKKLNQYGDLVVGFANGENTDQILTDYIENIQSAFDFSLHFKKRFLELLPTKKICHGKLTEKEYNLFEMLLRRNDIFKSCYAVFRSSNYYLKNYDPVHQMFTVSERHFIGHYGEYEDETFLIPKAEIEECIDDIFIDDGFDELKEDFKADLIRLAILYDDIEEIKSRGIKRFPELEKMAKNYPPIAEIHDHIRKCQEKLLGVLSQIMTSEKNAYKTDGFKSILSRYNRIQKQKTVIDNHGLKVVGPFNEGSFLKMDYTVSKEKLFNEPLSYCLVEFLKHPEYAGQKRIKKCDDDDCGIFYISSKSNPRQKYCPDCSKKNHTPPSIQKKRTQTSREAARKRRERLEKKELYNDQYQRLIKQGWSQKEAEKLAKEYVAENM